MNLNIWNYNNTDLNVEHIDPNDLNIDENYELTTRAYVDRLKQKLADKQKEEMEQIQAEAKKIKEHKKKSNWKQQHSN